MIPREKTHQLREGRIQLFSPPRGAEWDRWFGLILRPSSDGLGGWGRVLLTATQARKLAADLVRRAEDLEGRA